MQYPALEALQRANIHGPVDQQFVSAKFKASPGRSQPGTYLIRRDCNDHFKYLLHYISEREGLKVVQISNESGMFKILSQLDRNDLREAYDDIGVLVKELVSHLGLKTCLHPSEFDRAQSLLICRSVSATEADIIGQFSHQRFLFINRPLDGQQNLLLIDFSHLAVERIVYFIVTLMAKPTPQ